MKLRHWTAATLMLAVTFFLYCFVVYALSWMVA